jgi:hypothetical protein
MVIVRMIHWMVVMVVIVMRGFVMAFPFVVVNHWMIPRMVHRMVIRQYDSNPSHEQKAQHQTNEHLRQVLHASSLEK